MGCGARRALTLKSASGCRMEGMGLTIGTLAAEVGVTVETIRYYERVGLVAARGRSRGGYRQFDVEAVARLRFVRRATTLGFSLTEVRDLLALRARPGARCGAVRVRAQAKLEALEVRLREITALRDAVARLVGACSGETAVAHCNILHELESPSTVTSTATKEPTSCRPPRPPPPAARRVSSRASAASRSA